MQRVALIAVAFVALAVPANARAGPVFVFDQPSASPNDRVTVRTVTARVKPLQPFRIYLVRADLAGEVRSRLDPRVNFVGSLAPDRNGRGLMTFSVPPLDAGEYTLAYWYGRTFKVQQRAQLIRRYRPRALLRIDATRSCPVTLPNANRPAAPGVVVRERSPLGRPHRRRHLRGRARSRCRGRFDRQQAALGNHTARARADALG